jgi:hypothetical protein
MFTSAINSSINQNLATFQGQQQQRVAQQFQSLAQQLQASNLSTQTSALPEESLPASATSTPASPAAQETFEPGAASNAETGPARWVHRLRIPMQPGASSTSSQAIDPLLPELQSMPTSAVQAYSSLGQNLQQLGLNNDAAASEVAAQTSTMSVTF